MTAAKKLRRKKVAIVAACVLGSTLTIVLVVPGCMGGESVSSPAVVNHGPARAPARRWALKVMTLNVAHGRGDGAHQALRKTATIRSNLDDIGAVILRVAPDVVALQEADAPSSWSGRFNHVAYLAERANLPFSVSGEHVSGLGLHYGTALLSGLPLTDPMSITFGPSPPTLSKGFVVAAVDLAGVPGGQVDVVSVHLEFSRESARKTQVKEMIDKVSARERPLILMGDFNCEWTAEEPTLRTLCEGLQVRAYRPDAADMTTFPMLNKRLDWILISPELEFVSYEALPDVLSDHRALLAEIRPAGASR